jgi:CheY-like chemotaxis protein
VSHELNNPLAAMIGQAIMLEEDLAGRPEAERASRVRAAAERCGRIVQTFLAMARQRPPVRQPVHLNLVVRDALRIASYGLRSAGIAVEDALAEPLPAIPADPDQLHQVVVNLIVNAQQALQDTSGARRIRVASRREGDWLVLEVADNGPGVPPEVAPRIFEPFFTTKPMGSGTGVGLSLAHGILAAHGGRIELLDDGPGARFRITLPVDCSASDEPDGLDTTAVPERRHVLVVDDEPDVADTLADMLRRDGHRVSVAPGAAEARTIIAHGDVDLLLSDIGMPGEDGIAFHAWLREVHPELAARTAFVTGDTLGARAQAFLRACGQPVIEKPFTPAALRSAIAALGR